MRDQLKDCIINNNAELILELEAYFNRRKNGPESLLDKIADAIPVYRGRLAERIRYKNIEKEVKCGKYYLRIWVKTHEKLRVKENNEEIKIPEKEERDYLLNLRGSF